MTTLLADMCGAKPFAFTTVLVFVIITGVVYTGEAKVGSARCTYELQDKSVQERTKSDPQVYVAVLMSQSLSTTVQNHDRKSKFPT